MLKVFSFTLLFLIISCNETQKLKRNTINVALTTNISTLDPAISYDTVSAEVVYQIHETLYEYDYLIRPYHLKPLLAVDLPLIEENGLKYTIKIKKGVKYHPSQNLKNRTLKAQDFINQIKRLAFKPTKSNGWWLFDEKIKGLNDFRDAVGSDLKAFFNHKVEGLQAPDDHTLIIKLNKPYPQLLFALAMAFTTPVPEEEIIAKNNDLSQGSIGTGPFMLKEWKKSLSLELVKFPNYHPEFYPNKGDRISYEKNLLFDKGKQLPFIEGIKFNIMEEAQTRWLNFLKQNIDFIILNEDHFAIALRADGTLNPEYKKQGIELQIAPTLTYWWLAFNMDDPILGKNLNLRKAIAHAVDTERYIKVFTNNIALKANSIYPPGVAGYNPSYTPPFSYDTAKAKEFLAKAGYPKGRGLPTFKYDVRGPSSTARHMGEFIKNELGKIGIKIDIVVNTFPSFLNKARTGQLQFWQGGWAMDYPDPENTIQLLLNKNKTPGLNTSNYNNPKMDKLFELLMSSDSNQNQKSQILKDIEEIVQSDLPWVMQYYSRKYILYHKNIKNFRHSDLIFNNYKYLKLDE